MLHSYTDRRGYNRQRHYTIASVPILRSTTNETVIVIQPRSPDQEKIREIRAMIATAIGLTDMADKLNSKEKCNEPVPAFVSSQQ